MQIAQKLASYTMGHADVLRKAMGKKKQKVMDEEKPQFILGCEENNIHKDISIPLWGEMEDFAKYAFNKSHAACYAAISMQTAYLKCHYPLEFMAGLLSSVMDNTKKLVLYVKMCKDLQINILPPDVNASEKSFTIEGNSLRYGLLALKGVGENIIDEMLEERRRGGKFKNLADMITRFEAMDKRVAESFIKSGVMDFTGHTRSALLTNIQGMIANNRKENRKQIQGQMSMFDMMDTDNSSVIDNIIDGTELPKSEILKMEKETTGLYISGHPLDEYTSFIKKNVNAYGYMFDRSEEESGEEETEQESEENALYDEEVVSVAGMVTEVKVIYTKKSNKQMAFVTLEDTTGSIPCVVFPDAYEQYKKILEEGKKLFLRGTVSTGDKETSVLVKNITDMDTIPKKLWIRFETEEAKKKAAEVLLNLRREYVGNDYLILYCKDTGKREQGTIWGSKECIRKCTDLFGEENVKISV